MDDRQSRLREKLAPVQAGSRGEAEENGRKKELREKLARLMQEAAEVEVELSQQEGLVVGATRYWEIESRAHELGRQLSREVPQRQMGEAAAIAPKRARCPACETVCELTEHKRDMTSIDGPFEMLELKGHCPVCDRDFFPSAGAIGV